MHKKNAAVLWKVPAQNDAVGLWRAGWFEQSAKTANLRYIPIMSGAASTHSADHTDHSHCEGHGPGIAHVKLTPPRRAMLDILCEAGKPLGAYELIDRIAERTGKRPAPISVYRVLDFLVEHGLAHRLSSRNAFLACGHTHGKSETLAFLICDRCGAASEQTSPALAAAVDALAADAAFKRRGQVVELTGTCAACRGL